MCYFVTAVSLSCSADGNFRSSWQDVTLGPRILKIWFSQTSPGLSEGSCESPHLQPSHSSSSTQGLSDREVEAARKYGTICTLYIFSLINIREKKSYVLCPNFMFSHDTEHSSRQKWLEQWKYYFDSPLPTKVVSYVEIYLLRRPVWGEEVRIRGSKIGCDPCETSIKAENMVSTAGQRRQFIFYFS